MSRARRTKKMGSSRTCGDTPKEDDNDQNDDEIFPHVRGCTHIPARPAGLNAVLPAYAGIYHWRTASRRWRTHSSRTCGDAPCHAANSARTSPMPCPSRQMRGCTFIARHMDDGHAVLPACAGDPPDAGTTLTGHATSFPHMRGYAQDLQIGRPSARRPSRIRGDTPGSISDARRFHQSFPHTRGCTVPRLQPLHVRVAHPASAGIRPAVPRRRRAPYRPTRTCGYPPVSDAVIDMKAASLPNIRG